MSDRPQAVRAGDTSRLDIDEGLLTRLARLELLVGRALDTITAAAGVATADYMVLGVVRRSPDGRSSPTAICEVLGRTTGGMTLALDRLEAAGWVRRRRDPADGRRVVVELTPAGLALATQINDALHRWERSLGVGEAEARRIVRVLDEVADVLAAHPPRRT
jgi:DNA-binding MarR family transcriptional regulator